MPRTDAFRAWEGRLTHGKASLFAAFLVGFAVLGISDNILPLALFTEPLGGLGAVASRGLGALAPRPGTRCVA